MNKKELEAYPKQVAKSIKSEAGFRKMLTKVTVEIALNAELDENRDYSCHEISSKENYRNGYSAKPILTEESEVGLGAPSDRGLSFESKLVKKGLQNYLFLI